MTRPRAGTTAESGAAPRAQAAKAVAAVLGAGRSLDDALADIPAAWPASERALAAAMAYGVLRERSRLGAFLAPRLKRPPQPLLEALLLVGLYQLEAMRVPPHAAVHASVAAAGTLGLGGARGMVNAVLRGHQRQRPAEPQNLAQRWSHPDWLVAAISHDWPADRRAVLAADNQAAPMHLRVNARLSSRPAYLRRLAEAGIQAGATAYCEAGVTLVAPVGVESLPGFDAGAVSVQDGAAQLAAGLLDARDDMRVLDACAAPGNKAAHLLETAAIELVALDIDPARLTALDDNLARLHLAAHTRAADARTRERWWDGRAFDRILLDAPCSGTGVIRRHPDIKWLRRPADIGAAAACQMALLRALWPALAPGGRLVYATCSTLRAEGVDVVSAFLAEQSDAREAGIAADWGTPERIGRRIAPGQHGFDGFYYAVVEHDGPQAC